MKLSLLLPKSSHRHGAMVSAWATLAMVCDCVPDWMHVFSPHAGLALLGAMGSHAVIAVVHALKGD